jgi:hypothetical protein
VFGRGPVHTIVVLGCLNVVKVLKTQLLVSIKADICMESMDGVGEEIPDIFGARSPQGFRFMAAGRGSTQTGFGATSGN